MYRLGDLTHRNPHMAHPSHHQLLQLGSTDEGAPVSDHSLLVNLINILCCVLAQPWDNIQTSLSSFSA